MGMGQSDFQPRRGGRAVEASFCRPYGAQSISSCIPTAYAVGYECFAPSGLLESDGDFVMAEKYRLQPVLDKREKKKKDAEKILAAARAEVERQKQVLKQREEDVEKAIQKKDKYTADFMTKMQAGMDSGKITASKAFIEVLKQNIVTAQKKVEEQKKVVETAEQKVQIAVAGVAEATKEMKVIEKHKENWQDAVRKEIEEKEDKEQEEVAQGLYEQHRKRQ